MNLKSYLDRVGFEGPARPDLDTLRRLHRGHVESIPYENLDVQFGHHVSRDPAAIFDKLVTRHRGGWCYEMNGLLAWALEEIGFKITRMAGGVRRDTLGEEAVGNHLVLWVHLDRPYLADVGFGDGLIEPIPVANGAVKQQTFLYSLEDINNDWWRFYGDPKANGPSFDFQMKPADPFLLDEKCLWLQTNPASPFVQNAVLQRHRSDGHISLRGRTFKHMAHMIETREIASVEDYVETLQREFGLRLPAAHALWPKIEARHRELMVAKAALTVEL